MRSVLLSVVRFYQRAISPVLPPRCRFLPTCSAYAVEAIELHGAARGSWLALRRLAKCAPWHPGGVDLVPEPGTRRAGHASCTAALDPAPPLVTLPAASRASQEESSVA